MPFKRLFVAIALVYLWYAASLQWCGDPTKSNECLSETVLIEAQVSVHSYYLYSCGSHYLTSISILSYSIKIETI